MKKLLFTLLLVLASALGVAAASPSTAVRNLDDSNAVATLGKAARPYVIDFSASWCGPCRMFAPTFDAVANSMSGQVDFFKVDVDQAPRLAQAYRVSAVPTIYIYNPASKKSRVLQGVVSREEFEAAIASVK